jgi:hypothetical protein
MRELMDRMGHASTRAALIYIHSRDDRHTGVAPAMSELVIDGLQDVAKTADSKGRAEASSTERARSDSQRYITRKPQLGMAILTWVSVWSG